MTSIMRKRVIPVGPAFLLAAFAFLGLVLTAPLGWTKDENKLSEEARAAAAVKKLLIAQELNSLNAHEWAGYYFYGDGTGVDVDLGLAPKSGFVFTWNGCFGLYDLNQGDVAEENGRVKLVFTLANDRKGFQGIAPELIPILWGERHQLIPTDEVVSFANSVNAGFEPRKSLWGRFLLRRGDEVKPASGQPALPPDYSGYVLKDPIKAQISSIQQSRTEGTTRFTSVILNVGSLDGVKEGMESYVYSPSTVVESATVIRLNVANSDAEIIQYAFGKKSKAPTLKWKFSTFVGNEQTRSSA